MKVCARCGIQIPPIISENTCVRCNEHVKELKRKAINRARKAREQALRDVGMKKVRGTLGGIYWE